MYEIFISFIIDLSHSFELNVPYMEQLNGVETTNMKALTNKCFRLFSDSRIHLKPSTGRFFVHIQIPKIAILVGPEGLPSSSLPTSLFGLILPSSHPSFSQDWNIYHIYHTHQPNLRVKLPCSIHPTVRNKKTVAWNLWWNYIYN